MSERYLVTGGSGFIGSNIVHALVAEGHEVVVVDDLSTGDRRNLEGIEDQIDLRIGSVLDRDLLRGAAAGCRFVLHQAAQVSVPASLADPETNHAVNTTGTLRVFEAARAAGAERVVYAASCAVYGNPDELPNSEAGGIAPESPYAVSKYLGELYGQVWTMTMGLEVVCLRYFNVFGPRQSPAGGYAAAIPLFITRLLRGRPITIYGDGEQTRDFVYVGDVVRANLLACTASAAPGNAINVGGGDRITINELVRLLVELTATTCVPDHGPGRSGEVRHSLADTTRARALLGFTAQTSLSDGLMRTIEWYRDREIR